MTTQDLPDWFRASAVITNPGGQYGPSTGQVSVGAIATKISGAGAGRSSLTIYNLGANKDTVYLGFSSAVTTATGYPLEPGYGLSIASNAQVWAIAAAAMTVGFEDE